MLRLTNTLTKTKEVFAPIDPANVRMYVCGPTVYDFAHIGNARPVIVFDLLYRVLRRLYGSEHVTYVRNVTDVEDKISARALRDFPDLPLNEAIARVTATTERQFHEDVAALGVLTPEDVNRPGARIAMIEPRATEHIEEMRRLIDRLVEAGHAYVAEDHVLFHVPSMPGYGSLSARPLDEMEAGARVDVAPYKRSPLDFVLWKPSGPDQPAWPSPAGIDQPGRPGWHIECSAMSWKHLGETFDIHAGGIDLIFPHHENEVAQSRCCFGTPVMAIVWLHNGFLQVEGEKMSKSLGNFITIREVLEDWPGAVVRFNMLRSHYRQPIDWTLRGLEESDKVLSGWLGRDDLEAGGDDFAPSVLEALCDDLNTPKAIAAMHALDRAGDAPRLGASLRALGFQRYERRRAATAVDEARIADLLDRRLVARTAKDWAESDRIRDELKAMGVTLKDNKNGTTSWDYAK